MVVPRARFGDMIGSGGYKHVYRDNDRPGWVLATIASKRDIELENNGLDKYRAAGVRCVPNWVYVGETENDDHYVRHVFTMPEFEGETMPVGTWNKRPVPVILSAVRMAHKLASLDFGQCDLQFVLDASGRLVLNDPLNMQKGRPYVYEIYRSVAYGLAEAFGNTTSWSKPVEDNWNRDEMHIFIEKFSELCERTAPKPQRETPCVTVGWDAHCTL